jgi:hypothetical protein
LLFRIESSILALYGKCYSINLQEGSRGYPCPFTAGCNSTFFSADTYFWFNLRLAG